ncbi:FGGY-family carbohydrate kinase [Aidingimonas halophila]|uniref:L-xylulokinase n=1 Tax=Aidingimonas halophila TaxID=574349 RepID=A0A1H3FSC7_9GAMM|nr:FGGY-family carbohydrate kinase [Aidingimonas halophila]GHC38433.1 carbohydrate kinase [Aidingimonas halophila]SDX93982.1 L-xylulokinase [Aidingimonas halophila]
MTPTYLLGIDSGSTVTKAAIFDMEGNTRAIGRAQVSPRHPQPHRVERDMEETWSAVAEAIRHALSNADISNTQIAAIGITAHGDGLYLLDTDTRPLGPAIMSLDSRARDLVATWKSQGLEQDALSLTGQFPFPYAPTALLGWIQRNQPERFSRIGSILACKDWLRFCLTGELAADFTESSTGFTNVSTQRYSREALRLFGLESLDHALPTMRLPTDIAGRVTRKAAAATGLKAGTPVVAGLHDVTASAVGLGHIDNGDLTITSGTFSINEVFSDQPRPDQRWATRNGLEPGQWLSMAISPASSSNVDWFLQQCCTLESKTSPQILQYLESDLDAAFEDDSRIVYHPFLFGSPYEEPASAAFFGIQGWHTRAHLVRAILEGVVFNHRVHVDALATRFAINECRVTGGGAHTPRMAQLFADTLNRPVTITGTQEAAALGAALCAGVGIGVYGSLQDATQSCHPVTTYRPLPTIRQTRDAAFARYQQLVTQMAPLWDMLDTPA